MSGFESLKDLYLKSVIVNVAKENNIESVKGSKEEIFMKLLEKLEQGDDERVKKLPWPSDLSAEKKEMLYKVLNENPDLSVYVDVPAKLDYTSAKRKFYDVYKDKTREYVRAINEKEMSDGDGEKVLTVKKRLPYTSFENLYNYVVTYRHDLVDLYKYVKDKELLARMIDSEDEKLRDMSIGKLKKEYKRRIDNFILSSQPNVDLQSSIAVSSNKKKVNVRKSSSVMTPSSEGRLTSFIISFKSFGNEVSSYAQITGEIMKLLSEKFNKDVESISLKFKYDPIPSSQHVVLDPPVWRSISFKDIKSIESLPMLLFAMNQGTTYGSEEIDESYELNLDSVTGFVVESAKGGAGGGDKIVKTCDYTAVNVAGRVKNNNCLIATVAKYLNPKTTKSYQKIREECGIKHGEEISLSEIVCVENRMKICINVYNEEKLLRKSSAGYAKSIPVLLKDNHYYLLESHVAFGDNLTCFPSAVEASVEMYIFYDIETVYKTDGELVPYSIDWVMLPKNFSEDDINEDMKTYHYDISNCVDIMAEFIIFLESLENVKGVIIGYNSSAFDNYILLNSIIRLNKGNVTKLSICGNRILRMVYKGAFSVWDLNRHIPMGLSTACKQYNTKIKKVDGFNHGEFHDEYEKDLVGMSNLREFIVNNRELLMKYNKFDVLSCACLFYRFNMAMKGICGVDCTVKSTAAGLAHSIWSKGKILVDREMIKELGDYYTSTEFEGITKVAVVSLLESEGFKRMMNRSLSEVNVPTVVAVPILRYVAPLLNEECYRFVRDCLIGGRSEVFSRDPIIENEPVASIDCVSLYPYVMLEREYPMGAIYLTDVYVENCIGFYKIKVKSQKHLVRNIIPKRSNMGPLDWKYDGEIVVNCCNVDIECLKKYGVEFELVGDKHYYFKRKSMNIFNEYINMFKKVKLEQDRYRVEGDDRYNVCIRECSKYMQNALSGKVIEKLSSTGSVMAPISNINIGINEMVNDLMVVGNKVYCTVKYVNDFLDSKQAPCYLGVLIYAYARSHMYDNIIGRDIKIYNTETDSVSVRCDELSKLVGLIGNNYGEFRVELTGCTRNIFISPKNYCMLMESDVEKVVRGDSFVGKIKMKGVRQGDKLLDIKTELIRRRSKYEWTTNNVVEQRKLFNMLANRAMTYESFYRLAIEKSLLIVSSQLKKEVCSKTYDNLLKKKVISYCALYNFDYDISVRELMLKLRDKDKVEFTNFARYVKNLSDRAFVIRQRYVIKNIVVRSDVTLCDENMSLCDKNVTDLCDE